MDKYRDNYIKACEEISCSENFTKKTMKKVFSNANNMPKANQNHKKIIAVLAAVLATMIIFCGSVFAAEYIRRSRLSEEIEFSSTADSYAKSVESTAECNGISISLSEVLYENEKLYAVLDYFTDDNSHICSMVGSISVNGEELLCRGYTTSGANGEGKCRYIMEYMLDSAQVWRNGALEPFSISEEMLDFTIRIETADIMDDNGDIQTVDGLWEFEFSIDKDFFSIETVCYDIEKELLLENGYRIELEKIVCTPFSQRLYYQIISPQVSDYCKLYTIYADAVDSLGNKYKFSFSAASGYGGKLEAETVNIDPDSFSLDAEYITLTITCIDNQDGRIITEDNKIKAYKNTAE